MLLHRNACAPDQVFRLTWLSWATWTAPHPLMRVGCRCKILNARQPVNWVNANVSQLAVTACGDLYDKEQDLSAIVPSPQGTAPQLPEASIYIVFMQGSRISSPLFSCRCSFKLLVKGGQNRLSSTAWLSNSQSHEWFVELDNTDQIIYASWTTTLKSYAGKKTTLSHFWPNLHFAMWTLGRSGRGSTGGSVSQGRGLLRLGREYTTLYRFPLCCFAHTGEKPSICNQYKMDNLSSQAVWKAGCPLNGQGEEGKMWVDQLT